ncbi:MAG TPA: aspartate/glutamate racemase family protein [Gemmatimonadaceae bacterium]|nr:aspartate/glutamate racemase family protein [Gemmatimonadaceae bacterium]
MLGLIGGISWVSTVEYYRLINEGVNARLGGLQFARCIIHSLNFADVAEINKRQDWDAALELLGAAGENLKRSGAEGLVICANTMHVIADRLEARVGLPLIHIADATALEIRRAGLERVSLLGTRYTMELPFFRDRLAWHGITAVMPNAEERDFIHDSIFSELAKNIVRPETRDRYLRIIERMEKQEGAKGSILGCTEIPLLIRQSDTAIPVFDTTALHSRAAVDFALGD